MKRPALFALLFAGVLALAPIARMPARATDSGIEAGASKRNVLPFTVVPMVTTVDSYANPAASNADGLPDGLWDTFEPEPGFSSAGQIAPNGIWGEPFTDDNANGIFDVGEPFVDDPVNTRLDAGSANKWDGIYMAGYGSPRQPRGAFDPLWARALYLRDGSGLAVAQVSLDFLGWFSDWNDRVVALARGMDPDLDLDHLIVSHTHNHEGPDTHVGLWGPDVLTDGTYPKYERYVEVKMAEAIVEAAAAAAAAEFRFGSMRPGQPFTTLNGNAETLDGLQSRNSCRTPWVFDDELRVMHVQAQGSGEPIGTLVNWGTHVESLDSRNVYLSSDFVHSIRETVEQGFGGGVAVYVPGAQGAAEVVGDSCTRRWQRTTFDGQTFPVDAGGSPLATEQADTAPLPARDRTYALGRVVGSAAVRAIEAATVDSTASSIQGFRSATLDVPINNMGLSALSAAGVIDKPGYIGGVSVSREAFGRAGMSTSPLSGVDGRTALYAWRIGSASFVTAPGELAPELYWGLAAHNKAVTGSAHYDHEAANPAAQECAARAWSYGDTPGGHTGRPFEPGIRQGQVQAFETEHNFLLGYTPDLLGYIVPGYDFAWYAAPPAHGVGLGAVIGEAPDPCRDLPPDSAFPEARYGDHYQETNSASSMLAPAVTCSIWRLLDLDPVDSTEGGDACAEWDAWRNGILAHIGIDPTICDPESETDCVRHY